MPRISIGLPVYNGERYLEEAIRSILGQSYRDFELIISDNGSSDATRAICEKYAADDPRIRYYRNESNRGAAWNYNYVFQLAAGQYFKWAAHDDVLAETYLERCADAFERNPEVALCYPKTVLIDESGGNPARYEDGLDLTSDSASERFRLFLFRRERKCNPLLGLIRREILARTELIGRYNASDQVLLAHLALLGKFHEVADELMFRRIHSGASLQMNRTTQQVQRWFDPNRTATIILPTWTHFLEHLRIIRRTEMPLTEKCRCFYLALKRLWWDRYRLAEELSDSLASLIPRPA